MDYLGGNENMHYENYVERQIEAVLRGIEYLNATQENWYLAINTNKLTSFDIGSNIIEQLGYACNVKSLKVEELTYYGFLPNSYLFTLDMLGTLWASYIYIMQKWYFRKEDTLVLPAIKIEQLL